MVKEYKTLVSIVDDYEQLSAKAADCVINTIQTKRDALICIAGGDTPRGMLSRLVQASEAGDVDFSDCTFIGLDEWVGLSREDEGSCHSYLDNLFFKPASIREEQICFFRAQGDDLESECIRMDKTIEKHGGIDVMVLGIGVNGHLGFNEPGSSFDWKTHVIDLDETTQSVGKKYFANEQTVNMSQGITLGIKHILDAKEAILIADGSKKQAALKQMLHGNITVDLPASALRLHKNAHIIIDQDIYNL